MCGIVFVSGSVDSTTQSLCKKLQLIKHRGPDFVSFETKGTQHWVGHVRLALNGIDEDVPQPFKYETSSGNDIMLAANGEIYNQKSIRNNIKYHSYEFKSKTNDCEAIIPVMLNHGIQGPKELDGQFAFVMTYGDTFYIARDPFGICSLYYGFDDNDNIWCSSELKCIHDSVKTVQHTPPGCVIHNLDGVVNTFCYNDRTWMYKVLHYTPKTNVIYDLLTKAVKKRLMAECEIGLFLSGGLDSSIIAAIAQLQCEYKMKSFSVGFSKDAPDLQKARLVADHIGTDHHELIISTEDALEALPDVIKHIETYDVTTIRASVPMFLLAKYIASKGIKCCLSGEGSDEIFGGYLYFRNTNDPAVFHKECVRLLKNLHMFDCLRSHKSCLAHSLEVRTPFLDMSFVNYIMNMDPIYKTCTTNIEKYILRTCVPDNLLPNEIVWRQKEQFSDGVGYEWINTLKEKSDSTDDLENEEKYYYKIFTKMFNEDSCKDVTERWKPKWSNTSDPSGTKINHHVTQFVACD